jgi:flagellar biosynthetic protein FliO
MTELYFQTGAALALVIGVIVLLGAFLKKRQAKDGLMKIMGYQSLGPKKGIAMVKVGAEVLLVGVTATDIRLLKTLAGSVEEPFEETAMENTPGKPARVIVADVGDKLKRLKAMKDSLVCN